MGVANTVWPGRLERIHKNPDIILEVRITLTVPRLCVMLWINIIPASRCSLSLVMMGDKDMSGVIKTLINQDDVVYTVRADEGARAAEAADLAKLVGSNAVAEANLATAYDAAIRGAGN